jgi:RimJ/RimL family protein N-acetyltransferase
MAMQDWELWYKESADTEGIRLLQWGVELPKSEEMAKAWAEQFTNLKDTSKRIMFSIETLSCELVGGINIHTIDQKNGTFSFGVRTYTPYRGKGYAKEALRIVLRYGFYEMRFQKCNSGCMDTNEASIRLHKSLGFREEGRQRRTIYTNGRHYDHLLFGLTREEFDENEREYLAG